jgi:hypothetical protein
MGIVRDECDMLEQEVGSSGTVGVLAPALVETVEINAGLDERYRSARSDTIKFQHRHLRSRDWRGLADVEADRSIEGGQRTEVRSDHAEACNRAKHYVR